MTAVAAALDMTAESCGAAAFDRQNMVRRRGGADSRQTTGQICSTSAARFHS
jgi:hypothetical protein